MPSGKTLGILLIASAGVAGPGAATAQTMPAPAASSAQALPLVMVTARARHDRLDAAQAAERAAFSSDTATLLDGFAGAATQDAGGVSGLPVLDGLADDRLNVWVNGMDVMAACGNHMNPPLSYIAPSAVGHIEVYPGVAPVSVGGDAIGGAIVVEAPPPRFAAAGEGLLSTGSLGAYFRSNGHQYGGDVTATLANQNVSVWYRGSSAHAADYTAARAFHAAGPASAANASVPDARIALLAGDVVGSSAYRVEDQQAGIAWRTGAQLLALHVDRQRIPFQGFPNQRMDMTRNDGTLLNLHYLGRYAWGTLDARAYRQITRHAMDFGPDKQFWYGGGMMPVLVPGMPMDTRGHSTGGRLDATLALSPRDTLKLGASALHYAYAEWWPPSPATLPPGVMASMMAPDTFIAINDAYRNHVGAYGEWLRDWRNDLRSDIGLRIDRVSMDTGPVQGYNTMMYNSAPLFPVGTFNAAKRRRSDTDWGFSALLHYAPDVHQTWTLGLAQKTRAPNLYERYSWSPMAMAMEMIGWFGDGNGYIGNLALRPETARTLSLTADLHATDPERWRVRITPYYTHVDDFIGVQRCPLNVCGATPVNSANLTATTGFVLLQFVNQNARLYGVNLDAHAMLGQNTPWGSFSGKLTIAYVNGKNLGQGDPLYEMMPANARISLTQRIGNWRNTIETQLVAAKSRVSSVRNEPRTGGYALLNLRSSYTWKKLTVSFGIENALNKFYASPLGGAYLGQGPTMSFNGMPWGVAVPGMGRSYDIASTLRF